MTTPKIREAVAVFKSEADLQAAIDDLLSHGFDRAEISLLASSKTVDKKLKRHFTKVTELEDDARAPSIAYVATEDVGAAQGAVISGLLYIGAMVGLIPVVASGGGLAASLLAITVGGGSAATIGLVLADLIGADHADYISDRLDHGGIVLWVRTWNRGDEARAVGILQKHSGADVHVHGLADPHPILEDRYLGAVSEAERKAYRGTDYVRAGDGEYYVAGRVFSNRDDVQSYIERQQYLESLYAGTEQEAFDLEAALRDPESVFHTPQKLVASSISPHIKLEILRRWAYDAKSLETADTEGMRGPGSVDWLQDIALAIRDLEASL